MDLVWIPVYTEQRSKDTFRFVGNVDTAGVSDNVKTLLLVFLGVFVALWLCKKILRGANEIFREEMP